MKNANDLMVQVTGNVIAICDRLSPCNSPGFVENLLAEARLNTQRGGYLADHWRRAVEPYCRVGDIALWTTLFNGIFKIRIVEQDQDQRAPVFAHEIDDFLQPGPVRPSILKCPSGDLVVASFSEIGRGGAILADGVSRGLHALALERDFAQEAEHADLEHPAEYLPADGPDWIVHFMPADPA